MTIRTKHAPGDAVTYWQIGGDRFGTVIATYTISRRDLGKVITVETYLIRDDETQEEIGIDGRYVTTAKTATDSTEAAMISRDRD